MVRYPFGRTPYQPRKRPPAPPPKHDPLLDNASFSPQLSLMLSMVLKDGFCRNTALDLLRNIYPYVEPEDKAMIDKILGMRDFAQGYRPNRMQLNNGGRALSKQERDLSLLNIFKQFAGQDTVRMFDNLERMTMMQTDMNRMMNRLQNIRNMNVSSPDDLLGAMEAFMPQGERNNIRNMTNMMQLFKNMNNFKPDDLMRMFGGGIPFGNT
jgi:hypothetical protein